MSDGTDAAKRPFRFFDNREKYLMFVTTCGEKWAVAEQVGAEIADIVPQPPALHLFDAGTGDGTVLASSLRRLHEAFPNVPFVVVGKEISVEDLRLTLEKLPDRFAEHPQMVVVMTNMHYSEAPCLCPNTEEKKAALNWREVALDGGTSHEFETQINELRPLLKDWWQVRTSEKTGNPLYQQPSVLVLYRGDQKFVLDAVIPRQGACDLSYDLVIAAQPYRARHAVDVKVRSVLAPLAAALAPGGRMVTVQSTGQDPGMEIIRKVWPDEEPFQTPGPMLLEALMPRLAEAFPNRRYSGDIRRTNLFRYGLHVMPTEVREHIGTSTLLAAWNAAVYVAQIDDRQVTEAMTSGVYLDATTEVLARHGGLWFIDESFVVVRERD
ncbi:MAG: hypothetical protein GWP69_19795 [Gammaproteobacteria bacterium]|jgi:hypothetical protein|nr:hypothetical protein [Gammaproteobacteria bacterium]